MMQIFSLADSNMCNLMRSCSLASDWVNEYWKYKTIAYEIQNISLLNSEANEMLIGNIST